MFIVVGSAPFMSTLFVICKTSSTRVNGLSLRNAVATHHISGYERNADWRAKFASKVLPAFFVWRESFESFEASRFSFEASEATATSRMSPAPPKLACAPGMRTSTSKWSKQSVANLFATSICSAPFDVAPPCSAKKSAVHSNGARDAAPTSARSGFDARAFIFCVFLRNKTATPRTEARRAERFTISCSYRSSALWCDSSGEVANERLSDKPSPPKSNAFNAFSKPGGFDSFFKPVASFNSPARDVERALSKSA